MKTKSTRVVNGLPKHLCTVAVCIIANTGAYGALSWVNTTVDPTINGTFAPGEWNQASSEQDQGGLAGYMYAMAKTDYNIGAGNYTGYFQFLAHNIEQLSGSPYSSDFNAFDLYATPAKTAPPLLTVWVFNDSNSTDDSWLGIAGIPGFSGSGSDIFDDRGFYVYNNSLGIGKQWLPGETRPEDGGYDWNNYWGVYARGGFDNSAFTSGLPGAIDNDNPVYEVAFLNSGIGDFYRGIKDPDAIDPNDPNTKLVNYWEGVIPVPEPASSCSLLLFLTSGLFIRRRSA